MQALIDLQGGPDGIDGDTEAMHAEADVILLDTLRPTHPKLVELFEQLHKWYA